MKIERWIQSASANSATKETFTHRSKLVKLAAMVAALACVILVAALPSLLTLAIALPVLYICYEAAKVAGNFTEIINGTTASPHPALKATQWTPLSRLLLV